ncbi:MAG: YraN family protein [Syntrophomonadaceae bacterium]|jgi:putative endonuclease|nr:YraN family protein [Bacillota bacterium]NLP25303.1 YraN family protein [Syntrophomonadaceae bacterium]
MRKQIGKQGEDIAVRYLEQQGYRILNRNYHSRYGEIDVICERQRVIIFVEVKTRRSESYGTAEEAVTRVKQQRLRKTALQFLQQENRPFKDIQFDVIAVRLAGPQAVINHIQNAF